MTHRERLILEEILRERLQVADAAYQAARREAKLQKDLSIDVPRPDGTLMRIGALQNVGRFRELYLDALREFTDLTVHDKPPQGIEVRKQPASEGAAQRKAETA